ncbi:MAG TPA: hypothetical protein VMH80_26585 [Bryobacteraceae bacterium]|nr:hypothetical protein [Bryobacteraceae bacterium]
MHQLLCAVLTLALPVAALANVNGSVLLQTNMALNLESGAVSSSGGDFLWDGNNLTPQGVAKIGGPLHIGATDFADSNQSFWANYQSEANSKAIPAAKLVPGDAVIVVTTAGHLGAAFIASNSGGTIWFMYVTFGVSGSASVPVVGSVLNNSSLTPPLLPNYGVAPSSIFLITGSNLADPGQPMLQSSSSPGIPLTLNGTSLTVVVNGVTTHPGLYYTSPGQLAAVLPAATPVGNGIITVTHNGTTSAPAPIQVVASAVGINYFLYNTGVATDALTGAIFTFNSSATPGEIITLWTTGLGADPSDSDTTYTSTPHVIHTPLQVFIGGLSASILYQGASTYPGVDQINLTIPNAVTEGCWVSIVAQTGNIISNAATLPIHKGGGPCLDQVTGLTGNQVYPPQGQTLKGGLLALGQSTSTSNNGTQTVSNTTDAAFEKYTGLYSPGQQVSPGGCVVGPIIPNVPSSVTGLDVGSITLTGPNGLSVKLGSQGVPGAFYSTLSSTAITSAGGMYTFTGSGGKDVGAFTAALNLSSPLFTVTKPPPTTVDRTQGLSISWSGGNPGTYVAITGTSTSTGLNVIAGFTCVAEIDLGQFTIPSSILLGLPPGKGGTAMQNDIYSQFTASGLDSGLIGADINFHPGATTFQ